MFEAFVLDVMRVRKTSKQIIIITYIEFLENCITSKKIVQRKREREGERETETETERERDRERQRETEREFVSASK